MRRLIHIALIGNIVYIVLVIFTGIDVGFQDTASAQGLALMGLLALLVLNSILLTSRHLFRGLRSRG